MHERRNFILILMLVASAVWACIAWLLLSSDSPGLLIHRTASTLLVVSTGAWLVHALNFEDKLPNHLQEVVGPVYYEADGLSFMPIVRPQGNQAVLCVFYQNRFENTVDAVIHLRPPADSFVVRPGMQDLHFAFKAGGGDFGMIAQPIAVPNQLQGEVVEVLLAAATYYPRSHGARFRKQAGMPCGTLNVDWGGAAFKTGVHEVSGEIMLRNPVVLHLSMPKGVQSQPTGTEVWKQQQLHAGSVAA